MAKSALTQTPNGFLVVSKRYGYTTHFIRMKHEPTDEEKFSSPGKCTYIADDGKPHGKYPTCLLPGVAHIFGSIQDAVSRFGYKPYWEVFEDHRDGRMTFGNYASFSRGDEQEREMAAKMPVVNIDDLN